MYMMLTKQKKNGVCLLLCGIIVLIAIMYYKTEQVAAFDVRNCSNLTPLEQAFTATGAELQEVNVSAWVHLAQQDQNIERMAEIAGETANLLAGPSANIELYKSEGDYHTTVQVVGKTTTQITTITAQVVRPLEKRGEKTEAYLSIKLEQKDNNVDIKALEDKILSIIKKNGNLFSITTCLSGWVSGKLEEEKMTQVIRQAFQKVQAHIVEGIASPHFVSYAGMTESIDRSVTVGKKNINLNIAMRHHSTENRTYVTAATPIITSEY